MTQSNPYSRPVSRSERNLLVFLGLIMSCASTQASDDVVLVKVPRTAQVQSELVQLGDIAAVIGGNPALRRQIAQLDIVERSTPAVTEKLTIEQIALRVRLSGVPRGAFTVTGGPRVHVSWGSNGLNDRAVLESLRPQLAERLNVSPHDLELRLTRPLPSSVSERVGENAELRPLLPPLVRTGTVQLKVGIYQDNQLVQTIGVSVDVRIWRRVFVTNRRVAAGEALTDEVVRIDRRALSGRAAVDFADTISGQSTRRTLRAGTVVLRSDVAEPKPAQREIVIRNRDAVVLTARKGNLAVTLLGAEALQQGRIGDTIRVKNPQSGKIISARVVGASTVELRF